MICKVLGIGLSLNKLGKTKEKVMENMRQLFEENNKNSLVKLNNEGSKQASVPKITEGPITNQHNQVSDELNLIETILQNDFYESSFRKAINSKVNEELILNNDQRLILLKNLENQIISLELAQYAESVTKIECNKKNKSYLRLSCDSADKLPSISVNETSYKFLFKFRDSSNFLFSLDKTHPHSHIFM
jgi:hypothetical protein